jgi:hypothetical protein
MLDHASSITESDDEQDSFAPLAADRFGRRRSTEAGQRRRRTRALDAPLAGLWISEKLLLIYKIQIFKIFY